MCVHSFSRRQAIRRLVASSLVLAAPTFPVVAQASQITLEGGLLKLKRSTDGKVIYPGERVVVGTGGAVIRSRNQIFYMDDGTEAEFAVDADGHKENFCVRWRVAVIIWRRKWAWHKNSQCKRLSNYSWDHYLFQLAKRKSANLCLLLLRSS